jgi:hypothetical protein
VRLIEVDLLRQRRFDRVPQNDVIAHGILDEQTHHIALKNLERLAGRDVQQSRVQVEIAGRRGTVGQEPPQQLDSIDWIKSVAVNQPLAREKIIKKKKKLNLV